MGVVFLKIQSSVIVIILSKYIELLKKRLKYIYFEHTEIVLEFKVIKK